MITPIRPSTTMPDHISGMANERWNWMMVYPSPAEEANISEMTIRISAIDNDWRIPAMIWGIAAGRIKYRIRETREMRYVCELPERTSSMDRTPSTAMRIIRQNAPSTIDA